MEDTRLIKKTVQHLFEEPAQAGDFLMDVSQVSSEQLAGMNYANEQNTERHGARVSTNSKCTISSPISR